MITDQQHHRLKELVEVFLKENAKINLSALRDPDTCWTGNILDSLAALELSQFNIQHSTFSILDLGTGGGFPLIPLAICLPKALCTGLDSTQKKVDAMDRIVQKLGIPNVNLICNRAEQLGRDPQHREQYDIITARAVAELNVILEYAAPLLKVGGHIVAWKSLKIATELEESLLARAELSCHLIEKKEYELAEGWGKRQLLIFEKMHKTKEKYPREIGVPKKNPIT